jgi:adenylate kinase
VFDVVEKNILVNGFIFDGFPRTESQAKALDKLLTKFNTSISGMVALEVDDEILIKRLLERGKVSGRADDSNSLIIKNRIKEYYSKTAILKTFYQRKNCYFGVDGVGEIEEITSRITNVINNL